jgi:hypothetical protein
VLEFFTVDDDVDESLLLSSRSCVFSLVLVLLLFVAVAVADVDDDDDAAAPLFGCGCVFCSGG